MNLMELPNEMHNSILNEITDDKNCSAFNTLSSAKSVSKEFLILATDNIKKRNLQPSPKFKIWSSVRYNQEWLNDYKKRLEPLRKLYGADIGEQPIGKLFICSEPRWDSNRKTFSYDYEYGIFGNHEGTALEKDLELYSTMMK